jgi:tetratricopeptide (TPR) repeat protein
MEPVPAPLADYVPRAEEEQILAQLNLVREDQSSRVVLLYGRGGVGKTKLVRALSDRSWADQNIRWIPPLDVDDSNFWLLENLEREVAAQIDPSTRYFGRFFTYLAQLPKYVSQRVGRDTVASHHSRMREMFIECYRECIAGTGATVVITLDTVETIRSMYMLVSLTQLIKALPGTLFVLAGRPSPGLEGKDTIREYLEDPRERIDTTLVRLNGFRPADALAFLDASVLGAALTDAQKQQLVALTEGHPLWLALAVDYLLESDPPPEMVNLEPIEESLRDSFRRRLVTPYRSTEFWPEAIRRLAVVRHSVDESVWCTLMNDRELPPGIDDWAQAWQELCARPWIRRRANARYITLHDALAEELTMRLIPMHDRDEKWRQGQWRKAATTYDELVGDEYTGVLEQLSDIFGDEGDTDETVLLEQVAVLDTRKRELEQLHTAAMHYLLLSDPGAGTDRFTAHFADAAKRDDLQFQELVCHEFQQFLPPGQDEKPQRDAIGVVIERFRTWLTERPTRYLGIGLSIARFLIQNSQPRPALNLLDRLPDEAADTDLKYRLANERGNAWMRVPGEVSKAGEHFDLARKQADKLPTPSKDRRLAQAFKELGFYSRNVGQWTRADIQYGRASEIIGGIVGPGRPVADREELASIQTNWAYLKALQGQYEEARGLVESAMETRQKLGSEKGVAISLSVSGEVYRYDRQFKDAWSFYQKAEVLFARLRNWPWIGLVLQEKAVCLFQADDSGLKLVDEPVEEAKLMIRRALDICRDQAVRWYPSALNRAGRIFGRDNPDVGLDYFDSAVNEARKIADGWFLSASLIEYLELCYSAWTESGHSRYRDLIAVRVPEVEDAIREYHFTDLRGRWDLLQGHLTVHDALDNDDLSQLDGAVRHYSDGFRMLGDRQVGSHGLAALTGEFDKLQKLFVRLPLDVQANWYDRLRSDWSRLGDEKPTLLLAQLERLY